MTSALLRQIHDIARRLRIDRRTVAALAGADNGYGGKRCLLCEEFALTGGLKFVDMTAAQKPAPKKVEYRDLFAHRDG